MGDFEEKVVSKPSRTLPGWRQNGLQRAYHTPNFPDAMAAHPLGACKHTNQLARVLNGSVLARMPHASDATKSLLEVDQFIRVWNDLLDGHALQTNHEVVGGPMWMFVECAANAYNMLNPRISKVIADKRLVGIIVKNTLGPNSSTFMSIDSSAVASKSDDATAIRDRINVNKDVSVTETLNDSLYPPIYQFGFCLSGVEALVLERLPWLHDLYRTTVPRIYDAHTFWTRIGGALEITGYAPTAYSQNERRSTMSEVSNHVSNYKGITVTMRKSDEAAFKRLVQSWCRKERNLHPGLAFSWREGTWKALVGYNQNEFCQGILHCTDLFRTLLRSAKRMIRSKVQSSMCCMLYGLPGTGKTRTVFELANILGYNLFATSIVHDDADTTGVKERASIATQFANLTNMTLPFVLLIDDIAIENGRFTDCTLSRPKLLSLFEGQGFPSKSIVIMVSNHMDNVDISRMYDGAMCRKGRVQLIESKPLVEREKRRIRRRLRATTYRHVDLGAIDRVCDLFAALVDAETDDSSADSGADC